MLTVFDASTRRSAPLKAFCVICAALATVLSASLRSAHADGYQVNYYVTDTSFNVKDHPSSHYYPVNGPFPSGCGVEMAFPGPSQSDARPPSASASIRLADIADRTSRFRLADASDRVATLGGPVSTTVTWQGSSSPPACVVLEQDCFVTWSGEAGVTGHCSNPLGGSPNSLSPVGQSWSYSVYTVINNPGTTIPVPDCAPVADVVIPLSVQGAIGCECSVSVHPVNINLYGATPDASNKQNIIIGQQCTSAMVGLPSTPSGTTFAYSWSVSGTTFQDWEPSPPASAPASANPNGSYYVDGPGPLNLPTAQWYWNEDKHPETVSCTVTVTPPTNLGTSFTITESNQVNVEVPGWTAFGTGGLMQINSHAPGGLGYWLYAGPANFDALGGMDWKATVTSADPTLFGTGTVTLCQLITPNMSRTIGSSTQYWSLNGQQGLDTDFPYGWGSQPPTYEANDSPGVHLTSLTNITAATVNDQFDDYLLYMPPGANAHWVPLATFQWSTNGSATIPATGNWADFGTGSAGPVTPNGSPVNFISSHSFPSWTRNSKVANGHF